MFKYKRFVYFGEQKSKFGRNNKYEVEYTKQKVRKTSSSVCSGSTSSIRSRDSSSICM